MRAQNYNSRVIRTKALIKAISCHGLIVTQNSNVQYLTGFSGHDSWALVTLRHTYLITDSRYSEQAEKECPACHIIERNKPLPDTVAGILNRSKSVRVVAVEDRTPLFLFKEIGKKLKARTKAAKPLVEKLRQSKDAQEIDCIRKAGKIAISALRQALKDVKPGITEAQLGASIDYSLALQNSRPAFETIVAFGANASQPHYQPNKRKLRQNDTILIDFGATYGGYKCDITRCFAIGKPTKQYIRAYKTLYAAQKAAIETIRPGVKVAQVEKAAREIIAQTDFPPFGHGTGHGLGLDVHELPLISQKIKTEKLAPGQTVTIEPGIYIPGKLGIRIEDDVLVTEYGYEVLTPSDFKDSTEVPQIA